MIIYGYINHLCQFGGRFCGPARHPRCSPLQGSGRRCTHSLKTKTDVQKFSEGKEVSAPELAQFHRKALQHATKEKVDLVY